MLLLLLVPQTLDLTINLLVLGSVVCVRGGLRVGWRARGEHNVVLVLVELQRALVREVAVLLFEPPVGRERFLVVACVLGRGEVAAASGVRGCVSLSGHFVLLGGGVCGGSAGLLVGRAVLFEVVALHLMVQVGGVLVLEKQILRVGGRERALDRVGEV